ncbi:hypothetical protein CRE_09952 [Caenorhabditis remanei]|uniref:Uncharacterized protein n=1 Tax=Caenorhabditis remanei TaxID=31234 RepID=E3NW43_CAERE|nr:hypothetical protein CRE_09952 [Caenorhabditis remanei]
MIEIDDFLINSTRVREKTENTPTGCMARNSIFCWRVSRFAANNQFFEFVSPHFTNFSSFFLFFVSFSHEKPHFLPKILLKFQEMTEVKTQNAISLKGSAQLVKEFFGIDFRRFWLKNFRIFCRFRSKQYPLSTWIVSE